MDSTERLGLEELGWGLHPQTVVAAVSLPCHYNRKVIFTDITNTKNTKILRIFYSTINYGL